MSLPDSHVLVAFRNVSLHPPDLLSLLPGAWVGDAPLSFFMEHLACALPPAAAARAALLSPAVCSLVQCEDDPADLASALSRLALHAADLLLLPISDSADFAAPGSGTHWTLLSWRRGRGFAHQDSLGVGGSARSLAVARLVAGRLRPLLREGPGAGAAEVAVAPSVAPTADPSQAAKNAGTTTSSRLNSIMVSLLVCLGVMSE